MFYYIYNFLSEVACLPDEIIYKILFQYGGYTHPIVLDLLDNTRNKILEKKYINDYIYFSRIYSSNNLDNYFLSKYVYPYYQNLKKYVKPNNY